MKKTGVVLYPQFSEYELSVALSILMQGRKPIMTIAASSQLVQGESGLSCLADVCIEDVGLDSIDSLLFPGCMDISTLLNDESIPALIRQVMQNNGIIAAISSAPALLAKAGVLKDKAFTVGLTEQARNELNIFENAYYTDDVIVQDGLVITARGSGFIEFGATLGSALNLEFDKRWYG